MDRLDATTLLSTAAYGRDMFLTEALMQHKQSGIEIDIPRDARIATNRAQRWILSEEDNPRWRWSQGGALPILILRDAIVTPLQLSDPTLPIWPNHLTAATGLASSPKEWLYPRQLIREAFEEVAIATPTGLVVPIFDDPELDALSFGTLPSIMALIEKQPDLPNLFNMGLFNRVTASLMPLQGERDITVRVFGNECSSCKALPVIDEKTRGIDVMHAFRLDLSAWTLNEISIFCAESRDGIPTDSEMACLELDEKLVPKQITRTFKTGRTVSGSGTMDKMSPVLKAVLAAL